MMLCSQCKHTMVKQLTFRELYPNGDPRVVWRCSNSLWCQNERWAHPDGTPVSTEADDETKQCRCIAHKALEMLPKSRRYGWLRRAMNRSDREGHIGHLTKEECHEVVQLICLEVGIL